MAKPKAVKARARIHFEQVPLAVVKKIAVLEASRTKAATSDALHLQPASTKTEPYSVPPRSLRKSAS